VAVNIDQKNGIVTLTVATDVIDASIQLPIERVIFQGAAAAGSWTITDGSDRPLGPATYFTGANGILIVEFGGRKVGGFKLTAIPVTPVGCCLMLRKPRS
jgi:hypothetical protein